MKLFIIVIASTILLAQNFIYDERDWLIISNPGPIVSMTYKVDEIIFTSTKGVFSYNTNDSSLSFMNDFIRGINVKINSLIHYDSFRDFIWFINVISIH